MSFQYPHRGLISLPVSAQVAAVRGLLEWWLTLCYQLDLVGV